MADLHHSMVGIPHFVDGGAALAWLTNADVGNLPSSWRILPSKWSIMLRSVTYLDAIALVSSSSLLDMQRIVEVKSGGRKPLIVT